MRNYFTYFVSIPQFFKRYTALQNGSEDMRNNQGLSMNKDMEYIYNKILFSHEKEGNSPFFNNMEILEGVLLSKISQSTILYVSLIWNLKK